MVHRLGVLPPRNAPKHDGILRLAVSGDAGSIADLLTLSFDEHWDIARVREVLLENRDVPKTYVIVLHDMVVSVASYQLMPEEFPTSAFVHYVAADTSYKGLGLGYEVCFAVLEEAVQNGRETVYLTTDDFRLPAIATYLRLGFEPDLWHESHEQRWNEVLSALAKKK